MKRTLVISAVENLCSGVSGFKADAKELAKAIGNPQGADLVEFLLECGVIPERFAHDSSEEKLYAKYCDILLALAFQAIGIPSTVNEQRAESGDVIGKSANYSIVGDAKAFRLSRTAKNQKDFKVTALAGWRGMLDYACLVCPLYHYPRKNSQIYEQAVTTNVTLLGYVHLAFLVMHKSRQMDLRPLWNVAGTLEKAKNASDYWQAIDLQTCKVVQKDPKELTKVKVVEEKLLEKIKKEELDYLESEGTRLKSLSHKEAVRQLRKAIKLDQKISQIGSVHYWKSDT
jgi:type II restriction enzyme